MNEKSITLSQSELTKLIEKTVKATITALGISEENVKKNDNTLKEYLKSKIGKKITKSICTNETFFTDVYKRNYSFEIIKVYRNKVTMNVSSVDICPSGLQAGNSYRDLGEIVMDYTKFSKEKLLEEVISRKDFSFLIQYKINFKTQK